MKFRFISGLLVVLALVAGTPAKAAITCNLSSNGITTGYNNLAVVAATSFTMACTRASGDPQTQVYTVKTNNGLFPNGINNQASSSPNLIRYDLFTNGSCSIQWKGNTTLGGTIDFGTSLSASQTIPFWGCLGAGLNPAAGTYDDIVTLTPSIGQPTIYGVRIVTPANCSISTPPGNVTFNYLSLQASPTAASTGFATQCSKDLPYTMALDATSGILLGLGYTLALSASSATGTGGLQTFSINGLMAAGQAGNCTTATCTGSAPRTLTISF